MDAEDHSIELQYLHQQHVSPKATQTSHTYEHVREIDDDEELGYTDDDNLNTDIVPSKQRYDSGVILLSTYGIIGVAILSFMIAALIRRQKVFTSTMMILILCCTLLTTIISTILLLKFGRLQDQVQRLKEENREYDIETVKLKGTRRDLSNEIDDLENENEKLNDYAIELKDKSVEFNDLLDELKDIAKDGEEVLDVVDDLNGTFDRMKHLIYENEKAYLLSIYYDSAYRDEDNDMDKNEYNRFLYKISKRFRDKFQRLGSFEDLCQDDTMDLNGFLDIVDSVLKQAKDVMKEEFIKNYEIQKTICLSRETQHEIREELRSNY